ncbi:MAG TPA: DUF2157 domain-containing protein [Burkholderiales bacterium]|nr:DUF2157 domain-containing protein [Burkholderiales bacterium]
MGDRHTLFAWAERGAIADLRAALGAAGVLPDARDWRDFLDRLLLWSGAAALAAGVVFFVAYNWNDLGKYAKFGLVELLVVGGVLGYWRFSPERATGKASLLVASILLGALLALFGQTYQTGADTWELFANWAGLILPWVIVGRFAGLWMLWIAIANAAIVFYFLVFPGLLGMLFSTERQLWTLFVFNTSALVVWELAARRIDWLGERWAPRLLATASGAIVTFLVLLLIVDWREVSGIASVVYLAWLGCALAAYRVKGRDVLILAGGCLSIIVVVTTFLGKNLLSGRGEAGAFLFISLAVIAMGAASGWWLKRVANEERV